ncbi:TMCO4 family protein, partial [Vibrio parahaemolyticus]|uniref:TMCO4 family protein n=1 Tax=Vibrio parahaemolyticus TaxID=670 RepID=UPI002150C73D
MLKSTVEVGLKQWESATRNTEKAGYLLSRHIDRSEGQFILMGHSLGAKVIYHCLESMKMTDKVVSSVLFGGAIEKDVKWQNLLSKHSQMNILNAYSSNDSVLKKLYPFGSKMSNPIGLCPIELSCPDRLINIDMSEVVSGHTKYKTSDVGTFLQHYM